jgi:hypothetical protein
MIGPHELFLSRFAVECQLEPELGALASIAAGGGGGLELVTVMAMLPTVMAQLQTPQRRAELLHALGRAYNRAAEAA